MIAVITPILSLIGGGIGTFILYKIFPNVITSAFSEVIQQKNRVLLENIKFTHQKEVEGLKADSTAKLESIKRDFAKQIEIHKASLLAVTRYSEYQFKSYNELWKSLIDLKITAINLWEEASQLNLKEFSKQLYDTKTKVEQSVLLINDDHYKLLSQLIKTFSDFHIGKVRLIDLRNQRRNYNFSYYEVEQITANEDIKNSYISLIDKIAVDFKKYISQPTNISIKNEESA